MSIDAIKGVLKSKATKNGLWLYFAQFFNLICPLISIPYITRILGVEQYGIFSFVLNIIGYLQVVVEYGFAMSATRKVAKNENERIIDKLFTLVLLCRIILFALSMFVVWIYISFASSNVQQNNCMLILSATLFGYCIQLTWLFQGKQDMIYNAVVTMLSRSISLICVFLFVKKSSDIFIYCIIYALGPIIGNVVSIFIAKRKYDIRLVRISFLEVLNEFKDGWYVFTTQFSSKVFSAIGVTFLGVFGTQYDVGIFSALQKIPYVLTIAWLPISQVLYPITSQHFIKSFNDGYNYVKKISKYFVCFFAFAIIAICLCAKQITQIAFGYDYSTYYYLLFPQLLQILFAIINNFMGIQILLAAGLDKIYAKCFYYGLIMNILLNYIVIKKFRVNGAALAPLIAEVLLTLMLFYNISRMKNSKNRKKEEKTNE